MGWQQLHPATPFIGGWALDAMCEHLEAVTHGEIKNLLINVPPGCTKPGWVENEVMTSRGIVRLGDIVVGDEVLTHRGRYRAVLDVHRQGVMPLLKVVTHGGRESYPEPSHPYLTTGGWIQARDLRVGDALAAVHASTEGGEDTLARDEIASIEEIAPGECRCLTVSEDQSMTWGGVAVHNSMLVNIYWPAWEWGPLNRPHLQYISASYERGLSVQHMVRCREIMQGEWFQKRWGGNFKFKGDANMKTAYHNTFQGTRFASSVGASIVGYRGDRLIIDDPHDVHKAESDTIREDVIRWFAETLPTRKNNKDTATVVIMQRVHERDVSGFILSKELGYTHLCLPMTGDPQHPYQSTHFVDPREPGELLWPERFDEETVEELRKSFRAFGGSYAEAGQLEQRPSPRGGGMFQQKDFQFLEEGPRPDEIAKGSRGWDLAATEGGGSFTAGVKMCRLRDGSIVIQDMVRGQWRPSVVYDMIRTCALQDGPQVVQSIPQDPGQAGKDQKRHIASHLHGCTLHFSPESGSKVDRARPLASQAESGNLYLVRGPWNDTFIQNACVFPRGEFLDDIDAASRAYGRLIESRIPLLGASPRLIGG